MLTRDPTLVPPARSPRPAGRSASPSRKPAVPLHAHSAQRPESPPRLGGAACPDQQNSSASCCRLAPARGYATASAVANARKTPNRTPSPTRQPPPWPNHRRTTALRATAPFFVNRLFVTGHKGAVSRGRHEEAAGGSRHRASESPRPSVSPPRILAARARLAQQGRQKGRLRMRARVPALQRIRTPDHAVKSRALWPTELEGRGFQGQQLGKIMIYKPDKPGQTSRSPVERLRALTPLPTGLRPLLVKTCHPAAFETLRCGSDVPSHSRIAQHLRLAPPLRRSVHSRRQTPARETCVRSHERRVRSPRELVRGPPG